VALSQLSRACEQRSDHRPMLSDLRESGSIEQDADVVAFLYRDEYYNPETDKKNLAELIIAKQRNGPTGTIELLWRGEYTKFENLENYYSK
jgi:replicative DNA helicase